LRKAIDDAQNMLSFDSANRMLSSSVALQRTWLAGMLWEIDRRRHGNCTTRLLVLPKSDGRVAQNRTYRRRVIRLYAEAAELQRRLGNREKAGDSLQQAIALEKEISEPQTYTRLAQGNLHLGDGASDKARESFWEAVRLATAAVERRPEDMELRREQADCFERLAEFHQSASQWARPETVHP